MPLNDTLVQVRRVGVREWTSRSLLNVSFAPLQLPPADTGTDAPRTLTLGILGCLFILKKGQLKLSISTNKFVQG